jgi:hypothetical protein
MTKTFTAIAAVAALVAVTVRAEWSRSSGSAACRTNATSAVAFQLVDRGELKKLVITMTGGAAPTSNVIVADSDGTVIVSNVYAGTTTTYYTNETRVFIGLDVSTFGANTNAATVTVTSTFEK